MLALSPTGQRGIHSSASQISDMLGQAVLVGLGGVLVTALSTVPNPTAGVAALDLVPAAVAVLAAALVFGSDWSASSSHP